MLYKYQEKKQLQDRHTAAAISRPAAVSLPSKEQSIPQHSTQHLVHQRYVTASSSSVACNQPAGSVRVKVTGSSPGAEPDDRRLPIWLASYSTVADAEVDEGPVLPQQAAAPMSVMEKLLGNVHPVVEIYSKF